MLCYNFAVILHVFPAVIFKCHVSAKGQTRMPVMAAKKRSAIYKQMHLLRESCERNIHCIGFVLATW